MTYLPDLHSYLYQSSLLIQAYPTTRITTKYSLPKRPSSNPSSKRSQKAAATASSTTNSTSQPPTAGTGKEPREKREPAATLTLKTYHAESGICLKYQTDKAQEVGRLLSGLGRLAKGEIIEMPSTGTATAGGTADDKMDVDVEPAVSAEGVVKDGKADAVSKSAADTTAGQPQPQPQQSGGGGGKKKKKGKK